MNYTNWTYGISLSAFALEQAVPLRAKYPFLTHLQIKLPPPPLHTRLHLQEKCKALRLEGWELSFHAYPMLNFGESVAPVHTLWTDLGKETLELVSSCGGRFCVFHAGYLQTKPTPANRAKGLNMLTESLEEMLVTCEDLGVGLHLENIYSAMPGSELIRLCDSSADFDYLCNILTSEQFGICFDYGHASIFSDTSAILRQHLPLVRSLHLHENDGQKDVHLPMGATGKRNWQQEFSRLEKEGYQGYVVVENAPEKLDAALGTLAGLIGFPD